jgi:hypothetical protein
MPCSFLQNDKIVKIFFPLLSLIFSLADSWGVEANQWEKVKEKDGVEVFQKKVGDHLAFRGVGILRGTTSKFLRVLHDPSTWPHWVENLKAGKLIEKKSESHFIFHQVIGTPFPMKDREAVFQSIVSRKNSSTTLVEMKSVNHEAVKRSEECIRVEIIYSLYQVEELGKEKVRVSFENLSHSGGTVPKFLSNWAAQSYPVSLLRGIERVLQKKE